MRDAGRTSLSNSLLEALPRRRFQVISPRLEQVSLAFGDVLLEAGKPIRHVFFPANSLVSLLAQEGKRAVEVGLVGHEGMVGIPLALGIDVSPVRAVVQGSGTALRMKKDRFLGELRASRELQRELLRYSHSLMSQVTQISACNRLHKVEARLARWLLMTRDRLRSNRFYLTHEFLGHMLGVRRVGITQAAGELQRRKLIAYARGNIRILDARGLQRASCSCYPVLRDLFRRK